MTKNKKKPFISVVIPLYNKENYIGRAIQSITAQTYSDFEVIIIDDGSTDSSIEIAEQYIDDRFQIIRQENGGVSSARNHGIKLAKNKYIAFLDADDAWETNFLETIILLIEKFPQASMFATGYKILNVNNQVVSTRQILNSNKRKEFLLNRYFQEASLGLPPIQTSSICVTKQALCNVGMFPIGIKFGEDICVWSMIALKEQIAISSNLCGIYYNFGIEDNTKGKFTTAEEHFDLTKLLNEKITSDINKKHLEKFVEIYTLRIVAKAIRNNSAEDAKKIIHTIHPRWNIGKYIVLKIILSSLVPSGWRRKLARAMQRSPDKGY